MTDEQPPPTAGSPLTDEALRLVATLQQWARQSFPAGGPDGHGGPECQWCPLCQLMAVVRGDRPEVTARVTEAGTAMVGAFRALLEATAGGSGGGSGSSAQQPSAQPPSAQPPVSRVQHIDLGDPDR